MSAVLLLKQMQLCHTADKQVLHLVLTSLHAMHIIASRLHHCNPVLVRAVTCTLQYDVFSAAADNVDSHLMLQLFAAHVSACHFTHACILAPGVLLNGQTLSCHHLVFHRYNVSPYTIEYQV